MDLTELLLADLAGRTEWDQPPELRLLITGDDGSPRIGGRSVIPRAAWSAGRVPDVLAFAATQHESLPPRIRADIASTVTAAGCQGIVLFTETWVVPVDRGNVHAADQVDAYRRDHKLWQHPDRVSSRMLMVFLADGREGALTQMHGMEPVVLEPISMIKTAGDVPEQMRRLRDLICGSPAGRRQPPAPRAWRKTQERPGP
jgi:hypothetical protein